MKKERVRYKRAKVVGRGVREIIAKKPAERVYRTLRADKVEIAKKGDDFVAVIHTADKKLTVDGVDIVDVLSEDYTGLRTLSDNVEDFNRLELYPSSYNHAVSPDDDGLDVDIVKVGNSLVKIRVHDRYVKRLKKVKGIDKMEVVRR